MDKLCWVTEAARSTFGSASGGWIETELHPDLVGIGHAATPTAQSQRAVFQVALIQNNTPKWCILGCHILLLFRGQKILPFNPSSV